jgi:hypothetical protein
MYFEPLLTPFEAKFILLSQLGQYSNNLLEPKTKLIIFNIFNKVEFLEVFETHFAQ